MNAENKKTILAVVETLDKVSVSGANNLDMLLGCILTLQKLTEETEENNG